MKNAIINIFANRCPSVLSFLIANSYKFKIGLENEIWGGQVFDDEIQRNLKLFLSPQEYNRCWVRNYIINDIISSYVMWGVTPNEYFTFNFRSKNKKERDKFASVKQKDQILIGYYGTTWRKVFLELEDKWGFYQICSDFFKREVILLKNLDEDKIIHFWKNQKQAILKPVQGQCGKGIELIRFNNFRRLEDCLDFLKHYEESYILEELIIQDHSMAKWNETSVNTIRVASINRDGDIEIFLSFLKTGRKGFCTDNGGSGGIIAVIDHTNGKIISDGYDELNGVYQTHPDTLCGFKGYEIPRWQELLSLVKIVHSRLSQHRYIGFDFALSINKGWVLVEANWGAFQMYQSITGVGLKNKFQEYFV